MDKASILVETIAYLKELEQRVKELESSRAPSPRPKETIGWRLHDITGRKKNVSAGSKRKALEREHNDGHINIVNVTEM